MQLQSVAPLPGSTAGASDGSVELVALAQATALLPCRCQATHLSVLVHSFCDPLCVRVASNGLVEGINQNHLEKLVGGVFTHPVGAEHSQGSTMTASTFLQNPEQCVIERYFLVSPLAVLFRKFNL
uniref:Uncharacterized protein n=1 Tax=Cynoglossus semilaevis TaxID=244447 RepID=A0A3P8VUR2_CYNSE